MRLDELNTNPLPPEVVEKFLALADQQRGGPERAMLRVQHTMKGGVLSPVVEHVGDIIHRMSEHADAGMYLEQIVEEKVNRGLRYLTHPYGFEREMAENIRSNGTDEAALDDRLREYAREHAKLPAYNIAHYLAREASVAIGWQEWSSATAFLESLKRLLDSGKYVEKASSYKLDEDGNLLLYPY